MAERKQERQFMLEQRRFHEQYKSQHVKDESEISVINQTFDFMWSQRAISRASPMYKNGKNPNYFDEYFASVDPADRTNTEECKRIIRSEYEQRRWSYCMHLAGYKSGVPQKKNRNPMTVEFWRRFLSIQPIPPTVRSWYFASERKPGDIHACLMVKNPYVSELSCLCQSFSNCPVVPMKDQILGPVHVAVGFVDLGLVLDYELQEGSQLEFHGVEANPFAVAKALVLWEMIQSPGIQARWVVQVWFSTTWSKRATNEFLAAARRIVDSSQSPIDDYPLRVRELLQHWSKSKGVGLKKLVKRFAAISPESSRALFFCNKHDRIEMLRYHLTGAFGLLGDEPCSGSILMFDNPNWAKTQANFCVFQTVTINDIVGSQYWNGRYFHTAEIVKENRMKVLIEHAQTQRIQVHIRLSVISPGSTVLSNIAKLQPQSISWSNILDYMNVKDFHEVARTSSSKAIHFGYSMNWSGSVFGASLIDYPNMALRIIRDSEIDTTTRLKEACGKRRIFLTPIQHNPLNITAPLLARRCYMYWIKQFFSGDHHVQILNAKMHEDCPNHVGNALQTIACSWTYDKA